MIPVSIEDFKSGKWTSSLPKDFDYNLVRLGECFVSSDHPLGIGLIFESFPEDLTQAGFHKLDEGTPMERLIYFTEHQPSPGDTGYVEGQLARYRKIEHATYGKVWELIPESVVEA